METWLGILLIAILVYIGFDYGRLLLKVRRMHQQGIYDEEDVDELIEDHTPIRYIMIASHEGHYITDLANMITKAHRDVDVGVRTDIINEEKGFVHTFFENGDELIVYDYDTAQIKALSKLQKDKYAHRLFFDYKLPEGVVRAVIKKLDLLDYMVNIGICSEKSGGK